MPRCAWCGTFYSPEWFSAYGKLYCTSECWSAAYVNSRQTLDPEKVVFFTLVISVSFIVVNPLFCLLGLFFLSLLLGALWIDNRRFESYRRYLYRKDLYRDTYPELAVCEYCSHLNPPDVLSCQFCDASLKDSEMVEGEIPEWFKSTSSTESASTAPEWVNPKPNTGPKSILRKCEHCGAVYSYAQKADDGLYICQNCGRPFKRGARDE